MSDRITLSIPSKPDYLLTVRLAASSIGSRMGYNINDIEDIKTAAAEACLIIMQERKSSSLEIIFNINKKALNIEVCGTLGRSPYKKTANEDSILGQYLLSALAEDVNFQYLDKKINGITFKKKL